MKYRELVILLPCHSLEDFPLHHDGDEASGLLASWSALWHPALIASCEQMPRWHHVDDRPEEMQDCLLMIPAVSHHDMQAGLPARAAEEGARVIDSVTCRDEILAQALADLDDAEKFDDNLARDFLALGYCYLQVELLTRQMHYYSNLDQSFFEKQVVAAAQAAHAGDQDETERLLATCFDALGEERDHYYAVDCCLLDLTLVADTTLGSTLANDLASEFPRNLLISGANVELLAKDHPDTLRTLKKSLEAGTTTLVGGEYHEGRLPLMRRETILNELRRGLRTYEEHLNRRPTIYGRRTFGLTPVLPQILNGLGFEGALHATLDEGQFPEGTQAKIDWEGIDGSSIKAVAKIPIDASKPETFLNYSIKMGEAMGMDHVVTIIFAHWPGAVSPFYEDLRRIGKYGASLGKFQTFEEYFAETAESMQVEQFRSHHYRSPYLRRDVSQQQHNPLSTTRDKLLARTQAEAAEALETISVLFGAESDGKIAARITDLDRQNVDSPTEPPVETETDLLQDAAKQLAQCIATPAETPSTLVVNPYSGGRRMGLETKPGVPLPALQKPIFAIGKSADKHHVVAEVPGFGFANVVSDKASSLSKKPKPVASENLLTNEYLEARINPITGTLKSIHDFKNRGNRISQQLAFRFADRAFREGEENNAYSIMAADDVSVTRADKAMGEIVCRGRMLDRDGRNLADFTQTYQLWRGSRVLLVDIDIDPHDLPGDNPWKSYYCARFAWADAAAGIRGGVGDVPRTLSGTRLESPLLVELDMPSQRTAILVGGMPYHQRMGLRMLDSLLIVQGEQARRFRLGIALDAPHPMQDALAIMHDLPCVEGCKIANSGNGWLFHIDAKNVTATHWHPIMEAGQPVGFRVRLLETTGKMGAFSLRAAKTIASAKRVDLLGNPIEDCQTDGDRIKLEINALQWIEVEARW